MKQVFLPIIGVIAFIAIVGYLIQHLEDGSFKVGVTPQKEELPEVRIGETVVKVELADTAGKRKTGLSGHKELPADQGMLFVFEEKLIHTFWMKDMDFAIDIIWIDDDTIVGIDESAQPEPGVPNYKLKKYLSSEEANYVLEVNSGFAKENNIKVGGSVELPQL